VIIILVKNNELIQSKKSWLDTNTHFLSVINDPWYKVLMELQHSITIFTTDFFNKNGLKNIHLPVTTGSISSPMGLGSDSIPVKVNIGGVETYLADSMQFLLEYGCRLNNEGCYYIMPSFRGEEADERHLCQFFHSEAEIPGTLEDVMLIVEEYITYLAQNILESNGDDIIKVTGDIEHIKGLAEYGKRLPRMSLDDAVSFLDKYNTNKDLFITNPEGFRTLTSKGEKVLIEKFGGFLWVTHFDHLSVPFYQAFDNDKSKALCADLLFGIGEVIGCGQRHKNKEEISQALDYHNVSPYEYEWYTMMKEEFPLLTSGFGMGVERFILWLLKHDDIRDCQIVPRFNGVSINP